MSNPPTDSISRIVEDRRRKNPWSLVTYADVLLEQIHADLKERAELHAAFEDLDHIVIDLSHSLWSKLTAHIIKPQQ
jgi:hypothetical protein